jgi:trans-aconitate 2-methyltransferase
MEWDPDQYLRWRDERARPFHDLLARVGARDPRVVVDLGCGPGNLTRLLADRWPRAVVTGLDSSPAMVAAAAEHAVAGRLSFAVGDVTMWAPDDPADVVVCNAVLQWVPSHLELLGRLVAGLVPGGWLAFQVPGNFDSASHTAIAELRTSPRWRDRVGEGAVRALAVGEPDGYLERLASLGCRADVWETTYHHVLEGDDAVLEWVRGTALRPVLSVLDDAEAAEFAEELRVRLREAYPARTYGTVLPFRRIFAVAQRPAGDPRVSATVSGGRG